LNRLIDGDIPIEHIVDVGVRECTPELIKYFPEKRHLLFEPMKQFFPEIEENYSEIDHSLLPIALSNKSVSNYLVTSSLRHDGETTHSQISDVPKEVDGKHITSCEEIEVRRFDELNLDVPENFLLKVDVDGKDTEVLEGFGVELTRASVVFVEVTVKHVVSRLACLYDAGFQLVDVVDMVYYGNSIYQFDAVCVRTDLVTEALVPGFTPFEPERWKPVRK
jgi:FkbM family methyltransferase